jgi:hypothetical protein
MVPAIRMDRNSHKQVMVFWGKDNARNISDSVPQSDPIRPTNNRAELYSAIEVMKQVTALNIKLLQFVLIVNMSLRGPHVTSMTGKCLEV